MTRKRGGAGGDTHVARHRSLCVYVDIGIGIGVGMGIGVSMGIGIRTRTSRSLRMNISGEMDVTRRSARVSARTGAGAGATI